MSSQPLNKTIVVEERPLPQPAVDISTINNDNTLDSQNQQNLSNVLKSIDEIPAAEQSDKRFQLDFSSFQHDNEI